MNWITKIIKAGEKIKSAIHKRATKEDIEKRQNTVTNVTNIVRRLKNKIQ